MQVDVNRFVLDFNLKSFGAKGWKNSSLISCPHCGKDYTKFGVLLLEKGGVYKCFRCEHKGSIFKLLKMLNRRDLILLDKEESFNYKERLESFLQIGKIKEVDLFTEKMDLPTGSVRIFEHPYLRERGWTSEEFESIEVYICDKLPRHKNRLIFSIKENDVVVGYLSRSTYSKEWHDENLKKFKQNGDRLILRYDNSKTDFDKLVGGIDDIVEGETHTVIIVEGIFDKVNTDKVLDLRSSSEVKCVYTFGCHLSFIQLYKVYERGVENIILMFDSETITQTKSVSLNLSNYFNIFISEIKGGKDPGEMNLTDFELALSHLTSPIDFFANKLEKQKLRW